MMEQEIQEIIKKNLPAQVGDILRARLEQGDKDQRKIKELEEGIKNNNSIIISQNKLIEDYKKLDERNSLLDIRENAVSEKERNIQIANLTTELKAEQNKSIFAQNLALGLVRNIEYRTHLSDSKSGPTQKDQYGNMQYATHTVQSEEHKIAK